MAPGLIMVDMVRNGDTFDPVVNPNGLVFGTCDPTKPAGVCFSFRNPGPVPVTSGSARVFLWQCYKSLFNFTDPVTMEYEGQHCDSSSFIIPCPNPEDVSLTFSAPGLAVGAEATAQYTIPVVAGCNDFSAYIGVDVTFREPTTSDQAAGIRSAKDGPFVGGQVFQGIFPLDKLNSIGTRIKNFLTSGPE